MSASAFGALVESQSPASIASPAAVVRRDKQGIAHTPSDHELVELQQGRPQPEVRLSVPRAVLSCLRTRKPGHCLVLNKISGGQAKIGRAFTSGLRGPPLRRCGRARLVSVRDFGNRHLSLAVDRAGDVSGCGVFPVGWLGYG